MKKTAKILAVVMVCVLAVAVLVACGPNMNYDKAVKNLKDNKYTVMAMEENDTGFELAAASVAAMYGVEAKDLKAFLSATSKDGKDVVMIAWFNSTDAAKTCYETIEKAAKENKDDDEDVKYGRSGKVVWMGTEEGIKATR